MLLGSSGLEPFRALLRLGATSCARQQRQQQQQQQRQPPASAQQGRTERWPWSTTLVTASGSWARRSQRGALLIQSRARPNPELACSQ